METNWRNAVVAAITEALAAIHADDPLGVHAMLGCGMAAARLEEMRRDAERSATQPRQSDVAS
jgi:hypothetical protein